MQTIVLRSAYAAPAAEPEETLLPSRGAMGIVKSDCAIL